MSATSVEVDGLRVDLIATGQDIVDEVAFEIHRGEVLGLVGESGSGKTTVGMALLGHVRRGGSVVAGSIRFEGQALADLHASELRRLRGGTITYIPQDPGTALNPALRLGTQLREVLATRGWGAPDVDARIREVLEEVALPSDEQFLRRYPHQLSGGQQQRIAIAMAFASRPAVVVCDEPTTGLDVTTQARVLATIRDLCRRHAVAALYVSHDLAVVSELADRVAVMYAGRIVECAPRDEIFGRARHPYTRGLLRAVPDISGQHGIVGIGGRPPLPSTRPAGCPFHPRCRMATDRCAVEMPSVTRLRDDWMVRCLHAERVDPTVSMPAARHGAAGGAETPLLAVEGLDARYGSTTVVSGIELAVRPNECLAIVGESGSGKTTLARCLGGLHRDWTGTARFDGEQLPATARARDAQVRREIQYVFQNPYSSLNPRRTIGQIVGRQLALFGLASKRERAARVAEALERVSLSARAAGMFPDQLSGGERQRVAIARAVVVSPRLLLCDEVTSALDVSVQAAVVDLLDQLRRDMGLALIFITHDLALVRSLADRVMVMREGSIVESGGAEQMLTDPESQYARELLASTPSVDVGRAASPAARPA